MSWIEVEATFPSAPDDLSPAIEMYRTHGIENTMQTGDNGADRGASWMWPEAGMSSTLYAGIWRRWAQP